MKEWVLLVTYITKPGKRETFMQKLLETGVLEKIRQEKGCIGYEYYYPVSRIDEVLLIERWETEEDQILHLEQPHMEELKAVKSNYVIETQLEKMSFTQ